MIKKYNVPIKDRTFGKPTYVEMCKTEDVVKLLTDRIEELRSKQCPNPKYRMQTEINIQLFTEIRATKYILNKIGVGL